MDPLTWRNKCPGDLSIDLPEVRRGEVEAVVDQSVAAFKSWSSLSLDERIQCVLKCKEEVESVREDLTKSIALETGKPLAEARGELGAVLAKFELTIADALRYVQDEVISDGPHPALVRKIARGPAAVVAPFNFPIHLGHGAALAYLLAGNTVIFKPSPFAPATCDAYGLEMMAGLPNGVFQILQGATQTARELCLHPEVRSVCFTGSVTAGRSLAVDLAADYSKSLALEMGGKNALILLDDANVGDAATAAAQGAYLTSGQRCNATSRILVQQTKLGAFLEAFQTAAAHFKPGWPLDEATTFGPLISEASVRRYEQALGVIRGQVILEGAVHSEIQGRCGYYVSPAAILVEDPAQTAFLDWCRTECFAPVVTIVPFRDEGELLELHDLAPFGLTASVFTESEANFNRLGRNLRVGNLYRNLPTTVSPSTLPFGGLDASGNGKPGGRAFIRFAYDEQAIQWAGSPSR